jgi:hypothetical protein
MIFLQQRIEHLSPAAREFYTGVFTPMFRV